MIRSFLYRSTVNLLSVGLGVGLTALVGIVSLHWYFGRDLPDHRTLADYEPPVVSRVYAANAQLIGEFSSEKRIFVPYARLPKRVVQAFVAAEDQRFFGHPGIDAFAIARAVQDNITGVAGTRGQGGSTITQQVVKNLLLTPERTFDCKIKEMILSFRLERTLPKEAILELYVNHIFLGRRAYGVAAAAEVYFGKTLDQLTLAEIALLAALPQAPSRFDPKNSYSEAWNRRNYVIRRMLDDGYITRAEAEAASRTKIETLDGHPNISFGREYFVEEIRRDLLARYGDVAMRDGGLTVYSTLDPRLQAEAEKALKAGLVAYDRRHGWRGPVVNLADRDGDRWAEGWRNRLRDVTPPVARGDWLMAVVLEVRDDGAGIGLVDGTRARIPVAELAWARKQGEIRVEDGKPVFRSATGPPVRKAGDVLREGDVVLVEPAATGTEEKPAPAGIYTLQQVPEVNGALVAMEPHTGRVLAMSGGYSFWLSQYNSVTQAWRQPGSSFKTFVYLAALQEGFTPATMILDAAMEVEDNAGVYRPRNFSGNHYGLTAFRTGIEKSYNLTTLRLANATGLTRIAELAVRLGVADVIDPVPSMPLGSYETTAMRQVTAYAMIANGGRRVTPALIDRIQDRHGTTLYRRDERICERCAAVFDGQEMPVPTEKREQVVDEDSAFQMVTMLQGVIERGTGRAAGRLNRPVAGKTGTTNDTLDAWFVGFTPDLAVAIWVGFDRPRTLGPAETGGRTAAPIFRTFMAAALEGMPVRDFRRPAGIVMVDAETGREYYKRGTEPGTGKGRELDHAARERPFADIIGKPAGVAPEVELGEDCYRYSPADPYPRGRRPCQDGGGRGGGSFGH